MSLTNYQKAEILANTPEILANTPEIKEALSLMIAAFKDMRLNKFLVLPFEIECTEGKEVYSLILTKQVEESN